MGGKIGGTDTDTYAAAEQPCGGRYGLYGLAFFRNILKCGGESFWELPLQAAIRYR